MGRDQKTQAATIATLRERGVRGDIDDQELSLLDSDPRVGVRRLAQWLRKERRKEEDEQQRLEALRGHEEALLELGVSLVAGVDEVGAGPLAGPVYAGAVILRDGVRIPGINDSKLLSPVERTRLAQVIVDNAVSYAFGSASPEEIDRINILQAARLAMRRAVLKLQPRPEHLLVDSRSVPDVDIPQTGIVKGDRHSQSIAAASILAKVERDGLMERYAQVYPGYGFEQHRGYATRDHLEALGRLGPCPIHRRSFAPVRRALRSSGRRYA
jgi:ribonuclease HII